jgi:hypothetical protein
MTTQQLRDIAGAAKEAGRWFVSSDRSMKAIEDKSAVAFITACTPETILTLLAELEAAKKDAERMRSALERLRWNFGLVLSGKPCRDVQESLAEVDAALNPAREDVK